MARGSSLTASTPASHDRARGHRERRTHPSWPAPNPGLLRCSTPLAAVGWPAASRDSAASRHRDVGRSVPIRVVLACAWCEELERAMFGGRARRCREGSPAHGRARWWQAGPGVRRRRSRRSRSSCRPSTGSARGPRLPASACGAPSGARGASQAEEIGVLGLVEPQGGSHRVENLFGHAGDVALSSRVYHSVLTPARTATSSRRNP